jgi:FAD/FMN-containing dehydrogenase
LIATTPVARECHDPYYDKAKCDAIKKGYHDGNWRRSLPGAMIETTWETFHGQGCLGVNQTVPCNQGAVSIYTVKATTIADVQTTIRFASEHNIRLTVKNTGHDFLGRSSAPSSINLWLSSMKGINITKDFIPDGAPQGTQGQGAIILKSGVIWDEAYKAANDSNVVVVGAAHYSVGAAGGYCLGGGHSPISPHLGLCVDNVLQFTMVTADGQVHIANSHKNEDLFWALRGGGPGFGVVVEAVYRTHPAFKNMIYARATISTNDTVSMDKIMRDFYSRHDAWSSQGWSAYVLGAQGLLVLQFVLPDATVEQAASSFNPFLDYARSLPAVTLSNVDIFTDSTYYSWFNRYAPMFDQTYAGVNTRISSRFLPQSLFQPDSLDLLSTTMKKVTGDIASISPAWAFFHLLIAGGQVKQGNSVETSVLPAWREALVLYISFVGWDDSTPYADQLTMAKKLTESTDALRAITPGAGTYQNEGDPSEPDWQQSFFGDNYPRLHALKNKYDPNSLFICRRCVGSEDWDEDLMCRQG